MEFSCKDKAKIPKNSVKRLSTYKKLFLMLKEKDIKKVYSHEIAEYLNYTSSKVRKDLSNFGQFGNISSGYDVEELIIVIDNLMSTKIMKKIVLVGVGNLGKALLGYKDFQIIGYKIVAAFDNNPKLLGKKYSNVPIMDIKKLENYIKKRKILFGIISVDKKNAQSIANSFKKSGIKGILNFAPTILVNMKGIQIQNVDMSYKLEQLSYYTCEL